MIWLLASIGISSLLYVIFKLFQVNNVNTLHAIVINYMVAAATGLIAYQGELSTDLVLQSSWLPYSIVLGALFLTIFNVMALTSQRNGLSVASVASKMSLVIPVIAGVWIYDEAMGWIKAIGILFALMAVYFVSLRKEDGIGIELKYLILPVTLFIGSGAIDTILKYAESTHVNEGDEPIFSATCFIVAFAFGVIVLIYEAVHGRYVNYRALVGGALLGIPNYFSIYAIIRALQSPLESSTIFTLNHVGTVGLTTVLGVLCFRESLIKKNYIGLGMAALAILLILIVAK
jgi:drug/metabolite transporter (DMT)-like permease